jgi:glycosyltransferase involved in cell wall biosynthesis
MKPLLTVVIPCHNERAFLGRCLDSILQSDYPASRMEVLVADGLSSDGTRELIDRYAARDTRVRRIDNPDRITPAALNRAIDQARGEIVTRVDAHAAIAPDYLSSCVTYLENTPAANVGGAMRTLAQSDGPFAGPIVAALSHRFGVGNSYFRIGSDEPRWVDTVFGGCWRREVFTQVGLFNERLERSQDIEFSLRLKAAGLKTLLAPEIRSDYYARSDLRSFWKHNFVNGEWAVLPFVRSEIIPVRLRHLIPLAFAAALLGGAAVTPWSLWPLGLVVLPYATAVAAASIDVALRARRVSYLLRMPIVFASLHLGYGIGSVWGIGRIVGEKLICPLLCGPRRWGARFRFSTIRRSS